MLFISNKLVLALACARVAVAHFGLTYPPWRFDTLSEAGEAKYSQWTYPCKWQWPWQRGSGTTEEYGVRHDLF